jgi:hypothetical protein
MVNCVVTRPFRWKSARPRCCTPHWKVRPTFWSAPNLDAANILFNVLKVTASHGVTVGPILLGAGATAHTCWSSARRVSFNTACIWDRSSIASVNHVCLGQWQLSQRAIRPMTRMIENKPVNAVSITMTEKPMSNLTRILKLESFILLSPIKPPLDDNCNLPPNVRKFDPIHKIFQRLRTIRLCLPLSSDTARCHLNSSHDLARQATYRIRP